MEISERNAINSRSTLENVSYFDFWNCMQIYEFTKNLMGGMFVSYCLCNKLLRTWWLKHHNLWSCSLEVRSLKLVSASWRQVSAGLHSSLEALARNPLPCLVCLLEATCVPGSCPSILESSHVRTFWRCSHVSQIVASWYSLAYLTFWNSNHAFNLL